MSQMSRILWPTEKESVLIDLVSERPSLWNPTHTHFTKKQLRKASYEEIKTQMEQRWPEVNSLLTAEVLRKKFNSLKTYFQREERRLKQASSSAGLDTTSKWVHFQRMLFLRDIIFVGQSESNLDSSSLNEESNESVFDSHYELDVDGDFDENEFMSESPECGPNMQETQENLNSSMPRVPQRFSQDYPLRKRKRVANTGEEVIKTVANALLAKSEEEKGLPFHVGKLVEHTMKNLPPPLANDFMQRIFGIISEYANVDENAFFK